MKTLIFNGSPRINGDTVSLINEVDKKLLGKYKIVNAYRCDVSPCMDCRYCWKNEGCSIQDEMQELYSYIQECDNIIVGGGDGRIDKPYETACTLLHHMNCHNICPVVFSHKTNKRPAIEDNLVLNGVDDIIKFFNSCQ